MQLSDQRKHVMAITARTLPVPANIMKATVSLLGATIVLGALALLGGVSADDDHGRDELLIAVLQAAEGHDQRGWAYTQVTHVDAEAVGEDEQVTITERYDPSKAPGDQRRLIEVRDSDGTVRTEEDGDTQVDVDLPVYAELFDLIDSEFELTADTPKMAVYRVTGIGGGPLQFGDIDFGDSDLLEDVEGELIITKTGPGAPYVSEIRLHPTEDAGNIFADLEKMEIVFGFAPDDGGQTYLSTGFSLDLELEVLIFIDIDVEIESVVGEYEYVGEYGEQGAP